MGRFSAKNFLRKSTVQNGMWLYALQCFNTVIPLFTLPYITRILGNEMYGLFAIAINIIGYLQVITEYGFILSATREVVLIGDNIKKLNKLFTCVILSRSLLFALCLVASCVYIVINRHNAMLCVSFTILLSGLIGYSTQMNWLFQGKQDMKFISIISIISRLISLILIFALVKSVDDLPIYCIAYSIAPIVNGVIGVIVSRKKYNIHFIKVSLKDIAEELKKGWFVFTTQLSSKVFSSIGVTFMGIFAVASEVGTYAAIQKIPAVLLLIWAPISQVLYPITAEKMSISFDEGKSFVYSNRKIFLSIFIVLAIIIALFARPIVEIAFGTSYGSHYYWMFPLMAWLIVAINNNFLGIQILLGSGHDKEYSNCFQISVLCTVAFSFILIYFFGGNGAAVAPLLSELVLSALLFVKVQKINDRSLKGEEKK